MGGRDLLAEEFERHRPHLLRVAYRMLGTINESDDAVREAWLRISRADSDAVDNVGGWLTTVVGRVCMDMLRVRRARHEGLGGSWLPEPAVVADDVESGPEQEALIADSVGLALLVVLETLTPAERLACVLHDMFAVSYAEIATIIGRKPAAARRLASRARRRVGGAEPGESKQREAVDAFLAAAREGDFELLVRMLDPDVVFRLDGGADSSLARPPVRGAEAVARERWCPDRPNSSIAKNGLVLGEYFLGPSGRRLCR